MKNSSHRNAGLTLLSSRGMIDQTRQDHIVEVSKKFSCRITAQVAQNIQDSEDGVARQFLPSIEELHTSAGELYDPIGDRAHSPVKGIVHRYPDRVLLMPLTVCPVYCRFCFRKELLNESAKGLDHAQMQRAIDYIASKKEIWEVILSGGDPLYLPPNVLKKILQQIRQIPHVEIIRIHTRVPVVDSAKIHDRLLAILKSASPLYVVLHANHPQEFTPEAVNACASIVDAGIPMLSQSVLLKGVNDSEEVLVELMRSFVRNRIKPYYLHHGDLTRGTAHFRTTIQRGQELMRYLKGRFSGLMQPDYVLDIPGGHGKASIKEPCIETVAAQGLSKQYCITDYLGKIHAYHS